MVRAPAWAKGATILVDGLDERAFAASGESVDSLRPYMVVMRLEDAPEITEVVASIRSRVCPCERARSNIYVPIGPVEHRVVGSGSSSMTTADSPGAASVSRESGPVDWPDSGQSSHSTFQFDSIQEDVALERTFAHFCLPDV